MLAFSVLMEYWIHFVYCKENCFVFADLRRKIFLRTLHLQKSAAGKSLASFTLVKSLDIPSLLPSLLIIPRWS